MAHAGSMSTLHIRLYIAYITSMSVVNIPHLRCIFCFLTMRKLGQGEKWKKGEGEGKGKEITGKTSL